MDRGQMKYLRLENSKNQIFLFNLYIICHKYTTSTSSTSKFELTHSAKGYPTHIVFLSVILRDFSLIIVNETQ